MNVGEERISESSLYINNMIFKLVIKREKDESSSTSLGFYIWCFNNTSNDFICDTNLSFVLIPFDNDSGPIVHRSAHVFNKCNYEFGYSKFLDWDSVIDVNKGYVNTDGDLFFAVRVITNKLKRFRKPEHVLIHTFNNVRDCKPGFFTHSNSELFLNHHPWQISIGKCRLGKHMGVYASCNKNDKSNWSCEAVVTIKIIPVKQGVEPIVEKLGRRVYTQGACSTLGNEKFLLWDKAFEVNNGFVTNDGQITLQMSVIITQPLTRTCCSSSYNINPCNAAGELSSKITSLETGPIAKKQKQFLQDGHILTHTFRNVRDFQTNDYHYSDSKLVIDCIPWQLLVIKKTCWGTPFLGCFAACRLADNTDWSFEAEVDLKMLPVQHHRCPNQHSKKCVEKSVKLKAYKLKPCVYARQGNTSWGIPEFLSWNEMIDVNNGYITCDGNITMQLSVNITQPLTRK